MYPILHNLEKEGLLKQYSENCAGKIRKYDEITEAGKQEIAKGKDISKSSLEKAALKEKTIMFEFKDVKFKEILDIPTLYIAKDRITSLIGPSGSGKTTILKMLNKMFSPTTGHILFNGQNLNQIDSVIYRRQVAMLSQAPAIFDGDIKENLISGLKFQKRDIPGDDALTNILVKVKLNKELSSPTLTLSGGEKQRLALGRVLLLNSEVYLLDEPSSALDEATAEAVIEMIAAYAKSENKTLVIVTHSIAIARRFSDEIIEVSDGRCSRRPI